MYCPQCGTESSSGLQYCRGCGANLKIIGKAVALSEAVARSDRGPLPKINQIPVELEPVVRVIWLLGLIPALTGLGHIIAGLLIQTKPQQRQLAEFPQQSPPTGPTSASIRSSVTEHTTNLLDRESLPD